MSQSEKHLTQYITDEQGRKTAVVLTLDDYEELMEDLKDLAVMAERREETSRPHSEVVADLKAHGRL